jgi:hypothetical protein
LIDKAVYNFMRDAHSFDMGTHSFRNPHSNQPTFWLRTSDKLPHSTLRPPEKEAPPQDFFLFGPLPPARCVTSGEYKINLCMKHNYKSNKKGTAQNYRLSIEGPSERHLSVYKYKTAWIETCVLTWKPTTCRTGVRNSTMEYIASFAVSTRLTAAQKVCYTWIRTDELWGGFVDCKEAVCI